MNPRCHLLAREWSFLGFHFKNFKPNIPVSNAMPALYDDFLAFKFQAPSHSPINYAQQSCILQSPTTIKTFHCSHNSSYPTSIKPSILFASSSPSPTMASSSSSSSFSSSDLCLVIFLALLHTSLASRQLSSLVEPQPRVLTYHKGQLLTGQITIHPIWYGEFTPTQRAIVTDFLASLSSHPTRHPSVSSWWKTTESYYHQAKYHLPILTLGAQTLDESYSLGKRLTSDHLISLASRGVKRRAINVVLTSADVAVDGFCSSRCGTHGSSPRSKSGRFTYIWVGNSAVQCPGQCAWPFHQPIYGPQTPALVAPNGDVGVDGMVGNLASLLAGTVTNPFGNGYFEGEKDAPLEAASACTGVFGKGAYPGYAGEVLVDGESGGSFNAFGENGRKYLLPALVDPSTSACSTLV